METIKVNMSPNPLDVQTIHASQNDGEAREWGFELHNNGEKIDSSSISDQLVFKSYKGGTEQILPENGAVPVTAPFVGDIKYPDATRTNQEFLYRQSPTEKDGNAKIKSLYGNTLVWNQLVQNGNFADISVWQNYGSTFTVSGNTATVKATNASNQFGIYQAITFKANHKYFISFEAKKHGTITLKRNRLSSGQEQVQEGLYRTIETASADSTLSSPIRILFGEPVSDITNDYFMVKNYMIVDLTQMGIDSITAEQFTSLFPLPYYAYNQGTLLSFNGNGIKTVGFNQWDEEWESGAYNQQTGAKMSASNIWRCTNYISVIPNETYYFKVPITVRIFWYDGNHNFLSTDTVLNGTKTVPSGAMFLTFHIGQASYSNNVCINISSSKNGTYEPYTSSTTSLPISTYFPTGMKSAGTVYDELTPTKAITRIGVVDLGSLTWIYANNCFAGTLPSNSYKFASNIGATSIYQFVGTVPNGTADMGDKADKTFALFYNSANTTPRVIYVKDLSYTNATVFKNAMNGVMLYYELATPTETSFTTASLVTENAEIPLSNEDGVLIGKCTEELSDNPGFIDAKIKLSDSDGECYSNKIQLHVERSPQ